MVIHVACRNQLDSSIYIAEADLESLESYIEQTESHTRRNQRTTYPNDVTGYIGVIHVRSHSMCRTRFGHYQASSAMLE